MSSVHNEPNLAVLSMGKTLQQWIMFHYAGAQRKEMGFETSSWRIFHPIRRQDPACHVLLHVLIPGCSPPPVSVINKSTIAAARHEKEGGKRRFGVFFFCFVFSIDRATGFGSSCTELRELNRVCPLHFLEALEVVLVNVNAVRRWSSLRFSSYFSA